MNKKTKLGIFLDHSTANLISFPTVEHLDKKVQNSFNHQAKVAALQRGESTMNTKEQGEMADYYRELAAIIIKYDQVLLFGPTDAKTELYHTFENKNLYAHVEVEIKQSDKMTENQQHAL